MKADRASATALLIARGIVLADTTPALRPMLVGDSAEITRRLLNAGAPAPWFNFALRHRWTRNAIYAIERLALPGILLHWLVRKRLLDTLSREAIHAGVRQLVVLGAGLDTLAFRLQSRCTCFEVDQPSTQAIKGRLFPEGPMLVPADLLQAWPTEALRSQPRFAADQATLFIAEGLLMYLPPARVAELFREIAEFSAPGSRFAFTFIEARPGQPLAFQNCRPVVNWWLRWRREPFRWGLARAEANAFTTQHGWHLIALSSPNELRHRFLAPHGLENARLAIGESVAVALRVD